MGLEKRKYIRKHVGSVEVLDLTSLNSYTIIAKHAEIKNASFAGFLVVVNRKDIEDKELRQGLSLSALNGSNVALYLPQMNLDLDGTITRVDHRGKGVFEFVVAFSPQVPDYWRKGLVELLPEPGEIED